MSGHNQSTFSFCALLIFKAVPSDWVALISLNKASSSTYPNNRIIVLLSGKSMLMCGDIFNQLPEHSITRWRQICFTLINAIGSVCLTIQHCFNYKMLYLQLLKILFWHLIILYLYIYKYIYIYTYIHI